MKRSVVRLARNLLRAPRAKFELIGRRGESSFLSPSLSLSRTRALSNCFPARGNRIRIHDTRRRMSREFLPELLRPRRAESIPLPEREKERGWSGCPCRNQSHLTRWVRRNFIYQILGARPTRLIRATLWIELCNTGGIAFYLPYRSLPVNLYPTGVSNRIRHENVYHSLRSLLSFEDSIAFARSEWNWIAKVPHRGTITSRIFLPCVFCARFPI